MKNCLISYFVAAAILALTLVSSAHAGVKSEAAREAAEFITKKFAAETAEQGVETIAVRLESLAVKHGDEVFAIAKKSGPRAIHAVEQAGDEAGTAIKLLSRYGDDAISVIAEPKALQLAAKYGDDAVEAMIRHPGVAAPAIEGFGKPAAAAIKSLDGQNARRLGMMVDEGSLAKIGRESDMLAVIGKQGNRAMDFIWRNKGTLALSAALVAFLNDPEPFINGTKDLAKVVGENIGKPLADQAAQHFPWRTFYLVMLVLLVGATIWITRTRMGAMVLSKLRGGSENAH